MELTTPTIKSEYNEISFIEQLCEKFPYIEQILVQNMIEQSSDPSEKDQMKSDGLAQWLDVNKGIFLFNFDSFALYTEHTIPDFGSIKVRTPNYFRYNNYPGVYDEKLPTYNGNEIAENIFAMEGPTDMTAFIRMLKNITEAKLTHLVVLGQPIENERSKFYDYFINYSSINPLTIEFNGISITCIPNLITKFENISEYQLKVLIQEKDQKDKEFFIQLMHLPNVSDMTTLKLDDNETKQLHEFTHKDNPRMGVHCSAGLGRTSLVTIPIINVREGVFKLSKKGVDVNQFINNFLKVFDDIRRKRPGMCQTLDQFRQIIYLTVVYTAQKYNVPISKVSQLIEQARKQYENLSQLKQMIIDPNFYDQIHTYITKSNPAAHKIKFATAIQKIIINLKSSNSIFVDIKLARTLLFLIKEYLKDEEAHLKKPTSIRNVLSFQDKLHINKLGEFTPIILNNFLKNTKASLKKDLEKISECSKVINGYLEFFFKPSAMEACLVSLASNLYRHIIQKEHEVKAHESKKNDADRIAQLALELATTGNYMDYQLCENLITTIIQTIQTSMGIGNTERSLALGKKLLSFLYSLVKETISIHPEQKPVVETILEENKLLGQYQQVITGGHRNSFSVEERQKEAVDNNLINLPKLDEEGKHQFPSSFKPGL